MAEISPFQGVRYNQAVIKNMEDVICPPYDIISPEEQLKYHAKSEYNVIRLEHGLTKPGDNEANNKYLRSRNTFTEWFNNGILKTDNDTTFYIYEQGFTIKGNYRKRVGLIACVRLEPFSRKIIFPHEDTKSADKTDRMNLLRALNANVSPILSLYDDPGNKITKLMTDRMLPGRLLININNGDETHRVWKANEPEFVQRVSHFMSPKAIYIADGHHRYETALTYKDERTKQLLAQGTEGFNYIMMILVSFSDPGIIMLPIHRAIKKVPAKILQEFRNHLGNYFQVSTIPITESNMEDRRGNSIRVLGLERNKIVNLSLHSSINSKDLMPEGHSQLYYTLDISILEHIILQRLLGLVYKESNILHTADAGQALSWINSESCQLAFILNLNPVTSIKTVTDANDRMPRKSTYFYPKLPTGLIINRLDGRL